ncbi:acyl-CoA thioester hydrolase/BAAT C-terminal domain-containing protein [Branchiibius cervicis]|uniref:Acyl-CoA thioester hydrolase/BAAT C-terminal domain-containing protein n=1 Tax=Branchiibius cervicis TaxID=908252 RepID=A0ABW2AX57_9MICO
MIEEALTEVEGVRFVPDKPTGSAALVLAGSSGRVDRDRARVLAARGVLTESIRWFGGARQQPGPWEVPIELFLRRIDALAESADRVLVFGTSFGSEAALLAGALSERVDAVVAFAPSDVVWSGVTHEGRVTSHWTLDGQPLPWVPFVDDWEPDDDPPVFRGLYEASRRRFAERIRAATIPVERIPRVVLVAGGDDQVWPAVAQAEAIAATRSQHGLATDLVTDPEAGHRTILPGEAFVEVGIRMRRGGSPAADRRLGETAWEVIQDVLRPGQPSTEMSTASG